MALEEYKLLTVPEEIERLLNVVVETTPLIELVAILPPNMNELELIILVVDCDPARLEVITFADEVKLLLIFKLVTVKLVTVVVASVLVPVTVSDVEANILPAFKLEA